MQPCKYIIKRLHNVNIKIKHSLLAQRSFETLIINNHKHRRHRQNCFHVNKHLRHYQSAVTVTLNLRLTRIKSLRFNIVIFFVSSFFFLRFLEKHNALWLLCCVCVKRITLCNCLCSSSSRFSASRIGGLGIVNRYSWC